MSVVKKLYLQTGELIEFIKAFPAKDEERDQFFIELDEKLASRERLIQEINQESLTENEEKLGRELLKLNQQLTERMGDISSSIRQNLTELETKKATGLKYEKLYDGPSVDGVFFDTKS